MFENVEFNYFFKWSIWDKNWYNDWKVEMLFFSEKISHADHDIWLNRSDEHDSRKKKEKILKLRYRRCWKLTISSFHRLKFDRDVFDRIKDNECCKKKEKCLSKSDSYHKTTLRKKKRDYVVNQSSKILRNMRKMIIKDWFVHDAMKALKKTIDHRLKNSNRDVRKKMISINDDWIKMTTKIFMSSRLLIETKIVVIMSSSFVTRLKEKRNRKTTFVVFFFSRILTLQEKKKNRKTIFVVFFFSIVLFLIKKKKNQKSIFVDFFFDRASSSFFLTFSFVESSFAIQSFFSSLFSITLKKFAIMSKVLLNDISNLIKIRCLADFLNRIQDFFFSFVLSLRFIIFVSLSLILSIFSSFLNLSRSRKRARSTFSTSLKKKIKSANHCECILSIKWLDNLKKTRCFINLKNVEHFLKEFYYLDK